MRTLLAGELAQAQTYQSDYYIKLEVQNGSGTWIDVGAALGTHWIINATWGEQRDTPVSQATFTLLQRIGTASLAPLMSASVLNVDDTMAYSPLLDIGRLMRASTATMAHGVALDVSKYRKVFEGRIDNVEGMDSVYRNGPITILCSDLGAWLMDLQIETEGTEYGDPVTPPDLEDVLQVVIDSNIPVGEPAVTLVKQSASLFGVTGWKQGETKLMEALTTLVLDSVGEDLRYRFDASHVSQLMWFNPDRTRVTVDATFGGDQYKMARLDIALANIRNAGQLTYTDSVTGVTGVVTAVDLVSSDPSRYRRRFFRLASTSMLKTEAEAQTVIDAVVNDLSVPPAEASAEIPFCWFVQLYDRYTFEHNDQQYDQDQTFAVSGFQHTIEANRGSTVLTMTAHIVGAYAAWQKRLGGLGPLLTLVDFRKIAETDTTITYGWIAPYPAEVWAGQATFAVPCPANLWDTVVAAVAPLPAGTNSITVNKPAAEYQTYLQVEPRNADLSVGEIRRVEINATRDTQSLSMRIIRISETPTQVVVRLEVISPNDAAVVTVAYDNGGLTVTPASGGTLASTTDFTTTGHINYTIDRDVVSGTQRRVTFTASAPGYVDATDGVDVAPTTTATKTMIVSSAAFIPVLSGSTWTSNQDGLFGAAGDQNFIAFVPLPQGVTVTLLSMVSQAPIPASSDIVLSLMRQSAAAFGSGTLIATATRVAAGGDGGGINSSSAVSELVSTNTYCLLLTIGNVNHKFSNAIITYTMPSLDKAI